MPNLQVRESQLDGCARLFIQYICSYPLCLESVSFICNLRTHHTIVTRDPLNMGALNPAIKNRRDTKKCHTLQVLWSEEESEAVTISRTGKLVAHIV
jgi:hypothetical protein